MEDRKNRLEKDIKQITLWCQAWSMMQGGYGTHSHSSANSDMHIDVVSDAGSGWSYLAANL